MKIVVDHYKELEVGERAGVAEIKKAYRTLVLQWHPDKHPGEKRSMAEERIRQINAAYEMLGNPKKRETYDLQRRAVSQKKGGVASVSSSKMKIPKEFMVQPIGHPDRFVRKDGKHVSAQVRQDVEGDFNTFFQDAKMSLWWLPEENNLCRIRVLGSRAKIDKRNVRSGLAGGLNMAFKLGAQGTSESQVCLRQAGKGEKSDSVNFIAVCSPVYEDAYRFEAAGKRGHYLSYKPPSSLRVIPWSGYAVEEESGAVVDFLFLDFSAMYKFADIEEVLTPAVKVHEAAEWVPLETVREDKNVKHYFKKVLQKPMWDVEDFETYFAGHWTSWEYKAEEQKVRLRTPIEKLSQRLASATKVDEVVAAVTEAGENLKGVLPVSVVRLVMLITEPEEATESSERLMVAQRKLIGPLKSIFSGIEVDSVWPPLRDLLVAAKRLTGIGWEGAGTEFLSLRSKAVRLLTHRIVDSVALGKPEMHVQDLNGLLRLPGVTPRDVVVRDAFAPLLAKAGGLELTPIIQSVAVSGCEQVAAVALEKTFPLLGSETPEDEQDSLQNALAVAGSVLDVASHLSRCVDSLSTPALASAVAALGEGSASEDLGLVASRLAARGSLASVRHRTILSLALGTARNLALLPLAQSIATAVSIVDWGDDFVQVLLAIAKLRGSVSKDVQQKLLKTAEVLIPRLRGYTPPNLLKLVLSIVPYGPSSLLDAASEVTTARLAEFSQTEAVLITQALVQGFEGWHFSLGKAFSHWTTTFGSTAQGLTPEQVLKLTESAARAFSGSSSPSQAVRFFDAAAASLVAHEGLSKEARDILKAQVSSKDGLGSCGLQDELQLLLMPDSNRAGRHPSPRGRKRLSKKKRKRGASSLETVTPATKSSRH
mmetsp:Transcript_64990/g.171976  ORF Transcript_64990/g.171976 Transcript_64990/m.171976 type:complete len:877 (-) Transcript_64990:253-2883(-)